MCYFTRGGVCDSVLVGTFDGAPLDHCAVLVSVGDVSHCDWFCGGVSFKRGILTSPLGVVLGSEWLDNDEVLLGGF